MLHLDVTIPPGTTAEVRVPTFAPSSVTEGGRPAAHSPGVRPVSAEGGKAVFRVGPGRYSFTATLPQQAVLK
jgi:alpha-L-rhamnosidase